VTHDRFPTLTAVGVTSVVQAVQTPVGTARAHVQTPAQARALLLLGHGAGGGLESPDLRTARAAALAAGVAVALVEQPWRVAGRRIAEAAPRLDAAWRAVAEALTIDGPLLVGGRSSGARVACRTAEATGAVAVLALAFPLMSPRGVSRLAELRAPSVPRLVLQGGRDPFGVPEAEPGVEVHVVAGADHCFRVRRADGRTAAQVRAELAGVLDRWLAQTLT
jgi:predicted alpha/beta-hydrolase family hydrolase